MDPTSGTWLLEMKKKSWPRVKKSLCAEFVLFHMPGVRVAQVKRWKESQGFMRAVLVN